LRRDVGDGVIESLISEMKTRAFRRAEQQPQQQQQHEPPAE
jgi:hypothetical protein